MVALVKMLQPLSKVSIDITAGFVHILITQWLKGSIVTSPSAALSVLQRGCREQRENTVSTGKNAVSTGTNAASTGKSALNAKSSAMSRKAVKTQPVTLPSAALSTSHEYANLLIR